MKPFLLLCADPPLPHVAAALAQGLRVVAATRIPGSLAPALAACEAASRVRELVAIDTEILGRAGLTRALTAERKMPLEELLIRGAVGYAGIPSGTILYARGDLIHLAEAARRANRRPGCLGLRGGDPSQTGILFDLGYRDVVLHRDGSNTCHIIATDRDDAHDGLHGSEAKATTVRVLSSLILSLLSDARSDTA